MVKKGDDEIKRLLREILKSLRDRSRTGRGGKLSQLYRLRPRSGRGGYPLRRNPYRVRSPYYLPQPSIREGYRPRPQTRRVSYAGAPKREPIYKTKERLVYDPEVKQLLKEIRDRLEPQADKSEIEEKAGKYEEERGESLSEEEAWESVESLEKPEEEANKPEPDDSGKEIAKVDDETETAVEQNEGDVESELSDGSIDHSENVGAELAGDEELVEGNIEEEPVEDEDLLRDVLLEGEAEVLRDVEIDELVGEEAIEPEESLESPGAIEEALEPSEPSEDLAESPEVTEYALESSSLEPAAPEPVVEAIEAQDLSELEYELFESEPLLGDTETGEAEEA